MAGARPSNLFHVSLYGAKRVRTSAQSRCTAVEVEAGFGASQKSAPWSPGDFPSPTLEIVAFLACVYQEAEDPQVDHCGLVLLPEDDCVLACDFGPAVFGPQVTAVHDAELHLVDRNQGTSHTHC